MATPKTKVGTNISSRNIAVVVEKIGPDLIKLGKQLQPDVVEMNKLYKSRINNNIKAEMVINWWIQRNGTSATMEKLAQALMNIGRKQLAHELVNNIQVMQPGLNHITETEIDFIVNNIGNEWIQLATKLGLRETDVTDINQKPGNLRDKVDQVIDKWKRNKGDDATKEHMIDCLTEIGHLDIVNQFSIPTGNSNEDFLAGFKQQVVELYSHLNVPQPSKIDKDISIDNIFIDQDLEVFTLKSPEKPQILNLQSLIQNIVKHKMLRTLVEGDPGFGKTTLTSKIAIDWAKGRQYIRSLNFDLVLLIPLRELGNQHLLHFIVDMFNRAIECPTCIPTSAQQQQQHIIPTTKY